MRIKDMRHRLGIRTQADLAEKLGVSVAAVSAWECGARKPSYEVCAKLLAMGATVEELFGTTVQTKPPPLYTYPDDLRETLQVMDGRLKKLEERQSW